MSDNPKFEVIDRRKYKAEEEERESARAEVTAAEQAASTPKPPPAEPAKSGGPRLVAQEPSGADAASDEAGGYEAGDVAGDVAGEAALPPPPTAEESQEQKSAYDASSQRLDDLVRAQNPGAGAQPPITFDHLVQQLYVSAMIQMGAGTAEGQRPRVDIMGARQTIDLLGILQEKTKGNLTAEESRVLDTVLFEARMGFLEVTSMISMPGVPPPPPPKK
jgi:hypothetical protein